MPADDQSQPQQQQPSPLIEFHTIGHERFPPPYPASRNIPDWYKDLATECTTADPNMPVMPTIKRCPPFLEALGAGYIIPLADDIQFTTDAKGNLSFACRNDIVHTHDPGQYKGTPFGNRVIVKFINMWIIRTPPGYSTLLVQPMNRFHIPFVMLSGVVETDNWYLEIHFPAICQLPPNSQYVMKKGTPLMQAIPFARQQWQSSAGEREAQTRESARLAHVDNPHVYKDQHWRKKSFG
jgi:hypothetical protein